MRIVRFIYGLIGSFIKQVREKLRVLRAKQPDLFDKAVKWVTFFIPFVGTFAPVLTTSNWFRGILEFVYLSLVLVFQWSVHANRLEIVCNDLENQKSKIQEYELHISDLTNDSAEWEEYAVNEDREYSQRIKDLIFQRDRLAGFSHSVSDNVKKIAAELECKTDTRTVNNMTNFLQSSINSFEEILSDICKKTICASIKVTFDREAVKTYTRGSHNVASREGIFRCYNHDQNAIKVESNYAYIAIVQKEKQFFSEGNLLHLHNKFEADDVFFCEYGDRYLDYFCATVVMPIRIPLFYDIPNEWGGPGQNILGLLCIDCSQEIPEWSSETFKDSLTYHVIADYADSLALLFKEYGNEDRKNQQVS